MLKLLVAVCGLAICLSATAAPTTQAVARSEAIMADIDHFTLELKYHGNEDKPHYKLTLSVPYVGERKDERKDAQFAPTVQITADDAKAVFDHLATDGFLDNAIGVQELNKKTPEPTGPAYTLTLRTESLILTEDLGWSEEMFKRLEALEKVMTGQAQTAMDRLLERLAAHHGHWEMSKSETMDSMKVAKIAQREIEKLNWPLGAVHSVRAEGTGWSVSSWRVALYELGKPRFQAGGFRDFTIDGEGHVVRNLAGH